MRDKWIFHGEETYNLAPYQYPWAATMAENSLKNHWTPQEVGMGNDKACYEQRLSDLEKHMFIHAFASLTTADMAVTENLCLRVYGLIKAAEIRHYIGRQIAEEALHSVSYQHVIEVLGVDQHEVYNLYKTRLHIKQWFDHANAMTRTDDTLKFLAFYYGLFEGTWFPTTFAAIYSLQRRNLMTGTGEQIQYIHRDETGHVGFGMRLFREGSEELGYRPHRDDMHEMFHITLQRIDEWADYCIPDILGYNAAMHKQHARYLADRRLREMGYETLFRVEEALPWLNAMASINKEKNFFETRVTEYQSGAGLKFDDSGSMNDIMNWR